MISIIVSRAKNGVIGNENKVPWVIRHDLIRLKQLTLDKTVILGRKSYDSMVGYYDKSGRPMPGKVYIVVTRDESYAPARDNAIVAHSIEEAVKLAKAQKSETFVLGGSHIYEQMLPFCDRVYLTEVDAEIYGDTFFPELDKQEWYEIDSEAHQKDEKNEYDYTFVTLDRVKS